MPCQIKHGHAKAHKFSPTYQSWAGMIQRCTNPKRFSFKHYGGRGIRVCEKWMTFSHFLADMGERPIGMTISRINNNGNYEPGNCCWETVKGQSRNRRSTKILTINGVTGCVKDLCIHFGLKYKRTLARLRRGFSLEESFSPISFRRPRT